MKTQVRLRVIEDEMFFPKMLEIEIAVGISHAGKLMPEGGYMGPRTVRSPRTACKVMQRPVKAGSRYYLSTGRK